MNKGLILALLCLQACYVAFGQEIQDFNMGIGRVMGKMHLDEEFYVYKSDGSSHFPARRSGGSWNLMSEEQQAVMLRDIIRPTKAPLNIRGNFPRKSDLMSEEEQQAVMLKDIIRPTKAPLNIRVANVDRHPKQVDEIEDFHLGSFIRRVPTNKTHRANRTNKTAPSRNSTSRNGTRGPQRPRF